MTWIAGRLSYAERPRSSPRWLCERFLSLRFFRPSIFSSRQNMSNQLWANVVWFYLNVDIVCPGCSWETMSRSGKRNLVDDWWMFTPHNERIRMVCLCWPSLLPQNGCMRKPLHLIICIRWCWRWRPREEFHRWGPRISETHGGISFILHTHIP